MSRKQIYLDHGATTPVHPQVLEVMLPFWKGGYGNPSSQHGYGRFAENALENARQQIASLLNAQPDEIIFTGCGSESDNLALRGVMEAAKVNGRGNHLIISNIEHSAVGKTAAQLRDHYGFDLTILPVNKFGQIDLDELEVAIQPNTALISIMAANNEIGTLQPITEIGTIARKYDVLFHSDAVQAISTQPWDMATLPVDMISIAPHKFYGPKGIGVLYVRQGTELLSTLTGGGQEDARRAGTSNVAFAVGAAEALRLAVENRDGHVAHYQTLRDRLIAGILDRLPNDSVLTGHPTQRLPYNASFALRHISGNDLLMHLDMAGIAASSGSACKSGSPKPSATLEALGLAPEWTKGGLRLTVGHQNNVAEIDYVIDTLPAIVTRLQKLARQFV